VEEAAKGQWTLTPLPQSLKGRGEGRLRRRAEEPLFPGPSSQYLIKPEPQDQGEALAKYRRLR